MFTTKRQLLLIHILIVNGISEEKDVDINTDGFIVLNSYLIWLNN